MTNWHPVEGHPLLEVSECGRARSVPRRIINKLGEEMDIPGSLITPELHTNGYLRIGYKHLGKRVRLYLHRVIAKAFVSGWFEGAHVDHLDGNRLNNDPKNMEWVTNEENARRACAAGRGFGKRGEAHHKAKITDKQAAEIPIMRASGMSFDKIGAHMGITGNSVWYRVNPRWGKSH